MSASIDNAESTIKDNLDQWIFDWDVTHDEPERDGAPRTSYDAGFAAIAEVNR